MLRSLTILLSLLICGSISAQNLHSKNKKALGAYRQAQDLSRVGNIREAESLLLSAIKKDKSFDEAILLLHQLQLKKGEINKSQQTLTIYQGGLEQSIINRILADQTNYYFETAKYNEAKKTLDKVQGSIHELSAEVFVLLTSSVDFAIEQVANPVSVDFEALPFPMNEFGKQYFPSITATGRLVFTVRENNGRGDENIYESSFINNGWTKPEQIASNINTDRNEGTASIAADGSTLVFTACNIPGNVGSCDLYISYAMGSEWSQPELLSELVNSSAWDSQPALSRDGEKLYFVSRRSGGYGKQDIWYSEKGEEGWGMAKNLGAQINTPYDDCSPYIYLDQQTLFFASKGRPGMGGFDLYAAANIDGDWTAPKNLGFPINNSYDQVGYSFSPTGWAYYSSSLPNGRIELSKFKVPETILDLRPIDFIAGRVLDDATDRPLLAAIQVSESIIAKSDSINGRFTAFMGPHDTVFLVTSLGYESREFSLDEFEELPNGEVRLSRLNVGERVQFGNIYFDFNSAVIKPESDTTLLGVLTFLRNNPKTVLEIGGHTDGVGGEMRNLELSLERAMSVYRYFIEKGASKENLVFKGYGEQYPLTTGKSAKQRERNRRIEFKIAKVLE